MVRINGVCRMISYEYRGRTFDIYPEYTNYTPEDYRELSRETGNIIIGGLYDPPFISVCLVDEGIVVASRGKTRITSSELGKGFRNCPTLIHPFHHGDLRILPIICKEILYPEDYYQIHGWGAVDFITHHVGYPMYDKIQKDAWVALQKAMKEHFGVPVICSCGGETGPMNITGIVK